GYKNFVKTRYRLQPFLSPRVKDSKNVNQIIKLRRHTMTYSYKQYQYDANERRKKAQKRNKAKRR
ncbi:MAG: hypothetical protein AAFR81_23850, partial [Chloroflexota bacterium]